jgi:hypothetical protein
MKKLLAFAIFICSLSFTSTANAIDLPAPPTLLRVEWTKTMIDFYSYEDGFKIHFDYVAEGTDYLLFTSCNDIAWSHKVNVSYWNKLSPKYASWYSPLTKSQLFSPAKSGGCYRLQAGNSFGLSSHAEIEVPYTPVSKRDFLWSLYKQTDILAPHMDIENFCMKSGKYWACERTLYAYPNGPYSQKSINGQLLYYKTQNDFYYGDYWTPEGMMGKPVVASKKTNKTTTRIGAICLDGWRSFATGSGACSWHGGVLYWLYK